MLPYGVADGDVPFGAVLFDQDSGAGAGDEGKRKGEEVKDDGVDDDDDDDNADDSESDSPRVLEALLLSFGAFTGVL